MFVSALVWTLAGCAVGREGERLRVLGTVLLCAFGVFALWAGGVAADFIRFGGFVDITPQLGKEWPLLTSLGSWGVLLPLTAAGAWVATSKRDPAGRYVLAFSIGALTLLALALARRAFDWQLAGNATLLHQGRVWPPAHLIGAALAGVAATAAFTWAWRRRRAVAVLGAAVLVTAGAASPVFASVALTDVLRHHSDGFVYGRSDLDPSSFVRRAAALLGPDDVVAVRGPSSLAFHLFELSGCRLADYDDPRLAGNDLRIRYRDLADRWDARIATTGFASDWDVVPKAEATDPVVTGDYEGDVWALVRHPSSG
jgi:hypothetical protein